MSEGLEALHHPRIKSAKVDISAEGKHGIAYMFFGDTKQYAAIENELKEYEYWSNLVKCYGDIKAEDLRRFIHNGWAWEQSGYKKDKAFDIIKTKKVDVCSFINYFVEHNDPYETYVLYFENPIEIDYGVISEELLTEEEFDLLKEVFNR